MKNKTRKYSKGVFLHAIGRDKNDWRKQVKFINSLSGVEHVEVMIEEDLTSSEIRLIKSLLKNYKIIVHAPFIEVNPVSCHSEIREVALKLYIKTIRTAKILNAKVVTIHPGKTHIFQSEKIAMQLLIEIFRKLKVYQKNNFRISVENLPPHEGMFGNFMSNLGEFISLKKSFPGAYFTLDIGHAIRAGEGQRIISEFIKKYKNSILDIHFHDASFLKKKDHLALGKGDLDFYSFLQLLKDIDYSGHLSLEVIGEKETKDSWMKVHKPKIN